MKSFKALSLVLTLTAALSITACSKKKKMEDEPLSPNAPMGENAGLGDSDSGSAMGLQTIYFDYDSFMLTGDAKSQLKANASILKDNGSVMIQIEGHCDSRGGIQYNIALGEKRANAVKKYLQDLGVGGDRISTISYGKERLLDPGNGEEAHARNRRGNFVITAK